MRTDPHPSSNTESITQIFHLPEPTSRRELLWGGLAFALTVTTLLSLVLWMARVDRVALAHNRSIHEARAVAAAFDDDLARIIEATQAFAAEDLGALDWPELQRRLKFYTQVHELVLGYTVAYAPEGPKPEGYQRPDDRPLKESNGCAPFYNKISDLIIACECDYDYDDPEDLTNA